MNDFMLVLNAAEGRVQTLLLRGRELASAQDWSAPSKGTELLTPLLADTFRHAGISPEAVTRIACVAGPGSFTGIRLALATASALRRATGAALAGLNYLQALAAGLPPALFGGAPLGGRGERFRVRVLTHARRNLVHGQDFLVSAPDSEAPPAPVGHPVMLDLHGACSAPFPDLLIGSGVTRNLPFLSGSVAPGSRLVPGSCDQVNPHVLARLALSLPESAWHHTDIEPLYLRPCDAVDNLSSIAVKRGEDPDTVHTALRRLLSASPGAQH